MNPRRVVVFLLACAFGWVAAQAALLLVSPGLLASYDFPGHAHMAAVQMRSPTALWDTTWYAGYPTYGYPPLAHRLAGELMERLGIERGFKAAVALAYGISIPAVFAAARSVAGLPPAAAAAATLAVAVTPSLFRGLLFGQYPSLLAYGLLLGTLAALFASLRARRQILLRGILASVFVAALGSTHLYALLLLVVFLCPLAFLSAPRVFLLRVIAPVVGGGILAVLPSALFFFDFSHLAKTPIPHITRSIQMIRPAGLLNWVLYPVGLPVGVGSVILLARLVGGRRAVWIGVGAVVALVLYLRRDLGLSAFILLMLWTAGLGIVLGHTGSVVHWRTRYLAWAGGIGLWLALGPAGGLARLLPFAEIWVYDRPLLYGAPLAVLAIARTFWENLPLVRWRKAMSTFLLVTAVPLLVLSVVQVLRTYAWLVPGVEGRIPQGTSLQTDYVRFLKDHNASGRILALGFPPIVYLLPDVVGTPLIDGGYNDARVLAPLRSSGLEALANEKFIDPSLRMTRFFLANADQYGIEWVLTADRDYDAAIPLDSFRLVYESFEEWDRSVRIYQSIFPSKGAWMGDPRYQVQEASRRSFRDARWGTGGTVPAVTVVDDAQTVGARFESRGESGWVTAELVIPPQARQCNRLEFESWSPTGAALTVRFIERGHFRIARPETVLSPRPSTVSAAVDCQSVERIQIGISGPGAQIAYLTAVRFQLVRDATTVVPYAQVSEECISVSIPQTGATVTASVPFFPRWRAKSGPGLTIGSDPRGLLTLRGPAGLHTVCLAFPQGWRATRAHLPIVYLVLIPVTAMIIRRMSHSGSEEFRGRRV